MALGGGDLPDPVLIGGKAWSIAWMDSIGLRVPPAFVVTTKACARTLSDGAMPAELPGEIARGIAWLEAQTGRRFGGAPRPLLVSVRSGAAVSMPGMMDTVLNLGMTAETAALLAADCGDAAFARDTHCRFLELYASIVLKASGLDLGPDTDLDDWQRAIVAATGVAVPDDVTTQLLDAVGAVFASWNSRRARRYRQHHGIADDLGTAVTVQAMVFGNSDARSGTGVLFTRNPLDGAPEPYGEYLQQAQGEDLVSGRRTPQPLAAMRDSVPQALDELLTAAHRLEAARGDVQDIEFTVESGRLFLLQTRTAKRAPKAAVRIAVDLVAEGRLDAAAALGLVTPEQVRILLQPRLAAGEADGAAVLVSGQGASPGIGHGLVVLDPDDAEARAKLGEDVVLARPTTSPNDIHGMIAARAILTEQGGSTSHAAVVGRALGRPCIVGCGEGRLSGLAGQTVTVDGQAGVVYAGCLSVVTPDENDDPELAQMLAWAGAHASVRVEFACPAGGTAIDLDTVAGSRDPAMLHQLFAGVAPGSVVRGAVLASDAGIDAALAAHVAVIVTSPRLPALLQIARTHIAARG